MLVSKSEKQRNLKELFIFFLMLEKIYKSLDKQPFPVHFLLHTLLYTFSSVLLILLTAMICVSFTIYPVMLLLLLWGILVLFNLVICILQNFMFFSLFVCLSLWCFSFQLYN